MRRNVTFVLFAVLASVISISSAVDYCSLSSCSSKKHTSCLYPTARTSSACTKSSASGLTADEKERVVAIHNELRQKVASGKETRGSPGPQPATASIPNLTWDTELESIAQRWADQCTWGHDSCRNVERFNVGQNLALRGTTGDVSSITVESLVQLWYDEVADFNNAEVKSFKNQGANGAVVGHYSQLVWGKSTKIGCGAQKYLRKGFNTFFLVCNYGPAGNYLNEPVYATS